MSRGRCVDNGPFTVTRAWCNALHGDEDARSPSPRALCVAVAAILSATCAQLADESFLVSTIRSVGTVPDARRARLYGVESGLESRSKVTGVFQDPRQLSTALLHLAKAPVPSPYVEVGVWSGWTCCVVAAYLQRTSGAVDFHGYAVDVTLSRMAARTRTIMAALNVSFVFRNSPEYQRLSMSRLGICFIDGDHRYSGVRADYEELAPRCSTMVFHDVIDMDSLSREGGGVPIFWAELVANVRRERVHEFLSQPGIYPPVFGIGILGPGMNGVARPDTTSWHPAQMGAARRQVRGFWSDWLCKQPAATPLPSARWNSSLVSFCSDAKAAGSPPHLPVQDGEVGEIGELHRMIYKNHKRIKELENAVFQARRAPIEPPSGYVRKDGIKELENAVLQARRAPIEPPSGYVRKDAPAASGPRTTAETYDCSCFDLCSAPSIGTFLHSQRPALIDSPHSPWLSYLREVYGTTPPLPFNLSRVHMFYARSLSWPASVEWPMSPCALVKNKTVGLEGRPQPVLPPCAPATCARWYRQPTRSPEIRALHGKKSSTFWFADAGEAPPSHVYGSIQFPIRWSLRRQQVTNAFAIYEHFDRRRSRTAMSRHGVETPLVRSGDGGNATRQAEEEDMAYQARRLGHMIYPSGSWVEVTRMDDASYWVNRGN